jgi:hypothetical protein
VWMGLVSSEGKQHLILIFNRDNLYFEWFDPVLITVQIENLEWAPQVLWKNFRALKKHINRNKILTEHFKNDSDTLSLFQISTWNFSLESQPTNKDFSIPVFENVKKTECIINKSLNAIKFGALSHVKQLCSNAPSKKQDSLQAVN